MEKTGLTWRKVVYCWRKEIKSCYPTPHLACHSTPPPGPPPHPACLPSLTALPASSATTVFRALQCASASSSSCKGCRCGVHVNVQTPPIFYTPHLMFYVPPLKFYVLPQKFCVPHLIFYVPPPIFYVNLACDAVDTQLALPLPPSVVN